MKKLVSLILSLLILLTGCASNEHSHVFFAMDTVMNITVHGKDMTAEIEQEVTRLDRLLSVTDEGSDTYAYNSGKEISDETQALIERSEEISELTGGAFDIRIQPVCNIWDDSVPTDDDITAALKRKDVIGFGAIAKGYAADRVKQILTDGGVTSAVVSLGGNVLVMGDNNGSPWRVGIQHPDNTDALIATVDVCDTSVVTSGGYQRYFEVNGVRYHHIIDPKTGRPADSGILSATVISRDGTLADALSTAVYVMGVDRATELYKTQDIELIMVTDDTVFITEGIESKVTLEDTKLKLEVISK